jgi:hypothetical protein
MHCSICKTKTENWIDEKKDILYYVCNHCEFIFKSPEHYQNFSSQKERYNLHENNADDAGYIAYFQRFLDFVLPQINGVTHALDFGCGKSILLADMLKKEGIACDFYDPIYHPNTLKRKKKYDLIVSTEVFEHLHQPQEVFSRLVSDLHSLGYLALQTQFHPKDVVKFKQWYYPNDPTHIVFFRPKTFEILSEMFGCKVISHNEKNMVLIQKIV